MWTFNSLVIIYVHENKLLIKLLYMDDLQNQKAIRNQIFDINGQHYERVLNTYQMNDLTKLRNLAISKTIDFDIRKAAIRRLGWLILNDDDITDCSLIHVSFILENPILLIDAIMFIKNMDALKKLEKFYSNASDEFSIVKQVIKYRIEDLKIFEDIYNQKSIDSEIYAIRELNLPISALEIAVYSNRDKVKNYVITVFSMICDKHNLFSQPYITELAKELSQRCLSWKLRALSVMKQGDSSIKIALENKKEDANLKLFILQKREINQETLFSMAIKDKSFKVRIASAKRLGKKDAILSVSDRQPSLVGKALFKCFLLTQNY